MNYPQILENKKREPIRVINWPWLVVWGIVAAMFGVLAYFAGRL